jgi:hypothetical protein
MKSELSHRIESTFIPGKAGAWMAKILNIWRKIFSRPEIKRISEQKSVYDLEFDFQFHPNGALKISKGLGIRIPLSQFAYWPIHQHHPLFVSPNSMIHFSSKPSISPPPPNFLKDIETVSQNDI